MNYLKRNRWLKQNGFLTYGQYLETSHWQNLRQELFSLRGKKCERCEATSSIQIHHRTYARIGKEMPKDLVILCGVCHEKEHERLRDRHEEVKAKRKRTVSHCCDKKLLRKPINKNEIRLVCSGCGMRDHRMRRKLKIKKQTIELVLRLPVLQCL